MKLGLGALAVGACLALAGAASAEPELLLKCGGKSADGLRYTVSGGWQPYANPDRAVSITRDKGKLQIAFDGERSYTTMFVFALPTSGIKAFKVLGQSGVQRFEVFDNPATGKPAVRHTVSGADIRISTLDTCPVISPDVAVQKLEDLDKAGKR